MKRIFILLFITGSAVLVRSLAQPGDRNQKALALYREAVRLFKLSQPTKQTDRLALDKLVRAAKLLKVDRTTAPVQVDAYETIGVLKQTYGAQDEAIAFYRKAIASCLRYGLPDSLLFKPYLYTGSAYYQLHSFDSSTYYLRRAEAVLRKFPGLRETSRLYNSFGAIYYEAGNYQQSINYFRKAIQVDEPLNRPDKAAYVYSYKSNIASALRHLEQYDAAAAMYRSMMPLNVNRSQLLINLGTTCLEKNEPHRALDYLKRVDPNGNYDPVVFQNALGRAYLQKRSPDRAIAHLKQALRHHREASGRSGPAPKDNDVGRTYKLLADAERSRHNLEQALRYYQRSIIQLDNDFNDTVVYHNPTDVTAGFRSYVLFESLAGKAACLQTLYEEKPDSALLTSTIHTYQSALKLAEYIEKSFDTEDAQLFVVRNAFPVYQQAVTFLVRAYGQTGKPRYLVDAFVWAEKSKAATLYINLKDSQIKSYAGIPDSLLKQERNLKFNRSRLFLSIDKAATNADVTALTAEIRDNELALSRLAARLNEYPEYHRRKYSFDSIDVTQLRRKLINAQTALISYFQASQSVYCFVVTRDGIHYHALPRNKTYYQALQQVGTELRTIVPGVAYGGSADARFLYSQLIRPIERHLAGVTSLIIIPHNELGLLPFEVLEAPNGTYLLEKFAVTYQYAASFLEAPVGNGVQLERTLAMAPFDSINRGRLTEFARLPASDREIAGLAGVKLTHRAATKENFAKQTADASVIHLATHAVANSDDPSRSYIAFFPTGSNDRLYAHELRNAPLSNVQLIFLSACETASGKLVRGEGVMSLSRAFSYAGCPSLVTSLWKAEDNATAYISIRFYAYLRRGYPFAEALRQAKIDLIRDGQYAQFHSPQYWSHLVFIGTAGKVSSRVYLWVLLALLTVAGALTGWWLRRKLRAADQ